MDIVVLCSMRRLLEMQTTVALSSELSTRRLLEVKVTVVLRRARSLLLQETKVTVAQ